MKKNDFNELLASVKEAGSIKRGENPASRSFEFSPPDIKKVRRSLNVTQAAFSRMIGVSVDTLQNWEQGRREPEGPARALLTVAAKNPQAVISALHAQTYRPENSLPFFPLEGIYSNHRFGNVLTSPKRRYPDFLM